MNDIRCFHCGGQVCWDNDFTFEDYGYEEKGIIHVCHCTKCNALIEYRVPEKEEDDATDISREQ